MNHMNRKMQRLSLSDEAVARLVDPRTGHRLRPLGVVGGRTIYPMMGASPDDPSSPEGGTDGGDDPEGGKSPEGGGAGGNNDGDKPKDNPQAKIKDLEEEKERHHRRRREAEERAEAAEARLKELEGKDTPELEKLQSRVVDLEAQLAAAQDSLRESHLANAFLKDNTYDWHNPGRALALADMSSVEIDDDGKVHGLKGALEALVKSDPYLIKEKDAGEKDKKDPPPNTEQPGGGKPPRKDGKSPADRAAELAKKYPGLRR